MGPQEGTTSYQGTQEMGAEVKLSLLFGPNVSNLYCFGCLGQIQKLY